MALAGVLSAFRQLVLDGIELPASREERLALYRERFPGLSAEEAEDLSKMEPERLALYSTSVFSAEGSLIQGAFPLTVAIVRSVWPEGWGEFSASSLAQRVHRVAPWSGIHSPSLGECFLEFITRECRGMQREAPWLEESAALEQAMLEIRKAPDEPLRPQPASALDGLSAGTVAELLAQPMLVPRLVRVAALSWRMLAVRAALLESGDLRVPQRGHCILIGGRPHDFGVTWVEAPEAVAEIFSARRGAQVLLSELADAFVATAGCGSEEDDFRRFHDMVRSLVSAGCLVPAGSLGLVKDGDGTVA